MALNDVTAVLRSAAASLDHGEQLKSSEYVLSEAMNALELMDPKLDPGVAAALTPVAEQLATKALPLHNLTPKAVLLIMDKLLQLEVRQMACSRRASPSCTSRSRAHHLKLSRCFTVDMQGSWMSGMTFAQTVHGCLYTHPVSLQTLRSVLGLPTYKHMTEAHVGDIRRVNTVTPPKTAPDPAPAAPLEIAPVPLPPVAAGSPQHTLLLALFAYIQATLKSAELCQRAVLRGDLWEEDDWYWLLQGADLCWTVPEEDVLASLDEAEAALAAAASSSGSATLRPRAAEEAAAAAGGVVGSDAPAAPAHLSPHSAVVADGDAGAAAAGDGGASTRVVRAQAWSPASFAAAGAASGSSDGADLAALAAALCARLRFRRAFLVGHALLSDKHAMPAPPPVSAWGRRWRLEASRAAFAVALAALNDAAASAPPELLAEPAMPPACAPADPRAPAVAAATAAQVAVPGYAPEYRRQLITSSLPRCIPLPTLPATHGFLRLHLAHLQLVAQMPALASYDSHPLAPYRPAGTDRSVKAVAEADGAVGGAPLPNMQPPALPVAEAAAAAVPFGLFPLATGTLAAAASAAASAAPTSAPGDKPAAAAAAGGAGSATASAASASAAADAAPFARERELIDSGAVPASIADLLLAAAAASPACASSAANVPLEVVHAAATALRWPVTAKDRSSAALAAPQPVIPASGALDPPLLWPEESSVTLPAAAAAALARATAPAAGEAPPPPVGTAFAPVRSRLHGPARGHVSLLGLLGLMEDFSRLSADCIVRSTLAAVVVQLPPATLPALPPAGSPAAAAIAAATGGSSGSAPADAADAAAATSSKASLPAVLGADFADHALAQTRVAVIMGTHTILELAQRALVEAGVSLEQLAGEDVRRMVHMLCAPLHQLLRFWCGERLHIRRKADAQLRDWSLISQEADYLDQIHAQVITTRREAADAALQAACRAGFNPGADGHGKLGAAAAAAANEAAAAATAQLSPLVPGCLPSEEAASTTGTAAAPSTSVVAFAAPILLRGEHTQLHVTATAASNSRVTPWALLLTLRLMVAHMEIGFEDNLFQGDELAAAYWYHDHVTALGQRHERSVRGAQLLARLLPEACGLTLSTALAHVKESKALQAAAEEQLAARPAAAASAGAGEKSKPAEAAAPAAAADAAPAAASEAASGGAGAGKGGKAGKGSKSAAAASTALASTAGGRRKPLAGRGARAAGDDEDALLDAAAAEAAAAGAASGSGSASGSGKSTGKTRKDLEADAAVLKPIIDRAARARAAVELLRLSAAAPAFSAASDVVAGQLELCRAHIRLLACLHMAGRYRSMHRAEPGTVPPVPPKRSAGAAGSTTDGAAGAGAGSADASTDAASQPPPLPPAFFRDPSLAFTHRFRDFRAIAMPRPLLFSEFANAFALERYDADTARNLLGDALSRYDAAKQYLLRARHMAGSCLRAADGGGAGNSATALSAAGVLAAGAAASANELRTAVLLDNSPAALAPPAAAAAAAAEKAAAGSAKGKRSAAGVAAATKATIAAASGPTAFGVARWELAEAGLLPTLGAQFNQRQQLLSIVASHGLSSADPATVQALQQPLPLTAGALLHAGRVTAHADRLLRVCLTNRLLASKMQTSFESVFGPLAKPRVLRHPPVAATAADVAAAGGAGAAAEDDDDDDAFDMTAGAGKGGKGGKGKAGKGGKGGKKEDKGKKEEAPKAATGKKAAAAAPAVVMGLQEPLALVGPMQRVQPSFVDDAVFAVFALEGL